MASATRPVGPRSGHLPINTNNPPRAGPEGSRFPARRDSPCFLPPRPSPAGPRRPSAAAPGRPGPEDAPGCRGCPRATLRAPPNLSNPALRGLRASGEHRPHSARPAAARAGAQGPSKAPTPEGREAREARSPAGAPAPRAAPSARAGVAARARPERRAQRAHAGPRRGGGRGAGRSRSPPRTQSGSAGARLTCSTGRRGPSRTIGPRSGARVTAQASRCRSAPPPPPPFPPARRRLVPAVRLLHSPGPGAACAAPPPRPLPLAPAETAQRPAPLQPAHGPRQRRTAAWRIPPAPAPPPPRPTLRSPRAGMRASL